MDIEFTAGDFDKVTATLGLGLPDGSERVQLSGTVSAHRAAGCSTAAVATTGPVLVNGIISVVIA